MPDSGPLIRLQRQLRDAMALNAGPRDAGWGAPGRPMHQALRDVRKAFAGDDDVARPAREDMVDAVRRFFRKPRAASFTELKYVCYGVSLPLDADGVRLMDRTPLFQQLLTLVMSRQPQAKQFRRCYQALLAAYFGFEHHTRTASDAKQNWLSLRGFLDDRLDAVVSAAAGRGRTPEWLGTLADHRNLLTDQPCERYARSMRAGDHSELEGVCAGLEISRSSWVWHEAVMAYVHEVVRADDRPFQAELPQLLSVVDSDAQGHRLPDPVARNAVALGVARYALCSDQPEQPQLRDACMHRIGNPWLDRAAWDACVKSEPARQMVESWLKRRLIKDFFELLAHDGAADLRRLNYWLKWEPQIRDMWFVLGNAARRNRSTEFSSLKSRMKGRARALTGPTDDANNAFVMRIGNLLVIEFGLTNNACYVFHADNFRADLASESLNIYALKQRDHAHRMSHGGPWESKFDLDLRGALGGFGPRVLSQVAVSRSQSSAKQGSSASLYPEPAANPRPVPIAPPPPIASAASTSSRAPTTTAPWPSFTAPNSTSPKSGWGRAVTQPLPLSRASWNEIQRLCSDMGIAVADNRMKGGAMWVLWTDRHREGRLMDLLLKHGFKYLAGKGFHNDSEV